MKDKISISLFFSCIVICLCIGIAIGFQVAEYVSGEKLVEASPESIGFDLIKEPENVIIHEEPILEVAVKEDKLNADTAFVLLEKDLDTGKIVKSETQIPQKYIGLTREQLVEYLKDFEANPPLTELERGFISLELLSFSTTQVEVQMNYQYIQPTECFYIVAYDNYVVVMLEDKKTVFISTQIKVSELPAEVQQDVVMGLFIPNEETLYDFLENYTS